jgi:hypothetical protein
VALALARIVAHLLTELVKELLSIGTLVELNNHVAVVSGSCDRLCHLHHRFQFAALTARTASIIKLDFRSAPASLLPFCYRTAQYGARQGSIRQQSTLENSQLIQTSWYGMVGEVITVAELRMRCTGALTPNRSKPSVFSASNESFVGRVGAQDLTCTLLPKRSCTANER